MLNDTRVRSQLGKRTALAVLAALALIAYLFMNHLLLEVVLANASARGFPKTLLYLLWIGGGFAVFAAVLLTARLPGLSALLLLSCVSVATNYVYAVVVKQDITPDYMEWMVYEVHQLPQAWDEFRTEILAAVFQTLGFLAAFVLIRAAIRRYALIPHALLSRRRVRILAVGGFLGFHGLAMLLPFSYTMAETNLYVYGVPASLTVPAPERGPVAVRPEAEPHVEKIVLVIDESVGHKVYAQVIAPILGHLPLLDYGEAASTAACSAPSNALLRWGLQKEGVGQAGYDARTNPTIWAYASAAGFKTVLIDGQSKGAKQNFISSSELALVGEFVAADTGIDSDHRIADLLKARLRQPGRELIYVLKRGNHFPYYTKYPKGALAKDAPLAAKYAAAVSYSTGSFFRLLTAQLPLANVMLIYTSDHGQNLNSRAYHCSGAHHPDEYSVPLHVLTGSPHMRDLLAPGVPVMRDRASHLNIFPTLLYAMGYPGDWITATYGPTLAGPATEYTWVDGWLAHPTRRDTSVNFVKTRHFPGRGTVGPEAVHSPLTAP